MTGRLLADGRLDVADVVAEAAVAGDAHDLPVGRRELGPERGGERPAERAVGAHEVASGLTLISASAPAHAAE